MIQIYEKTNTDYSKNGNIVIEAISCDIEANLNGTWELTLTAPVDTDGRYKFIQNDAVICTDTWVGEKQLFRIYNTIVSDTEVIAYARPIFMDSAGEVFLVDVRPTNRNGQEALDIIFSGQSKYKGQSDILKRSTAYFVRQNAISAIQSDEENSFLNRWGGEVSYNNYLITVNERIGQDNGVRVEMGYNCVGIEADVDVQNVVTRIVPVAYNGYTLEGDRPWVDSPLINSYPIIRTKEIKFEDIKLQEDCQEDEVGYATLDDLRKALVKACEEQFDLGIDKPTSNYTCNMIDLAKTEEYQDVKDLEKVELGDTVHCLDKRIGIDVEARIIRVVYDCIRQLNKDVELGTFKENFFDEMESTIQRVDSAIDGSGNVIADKIQGVIDGAKTSLRAQRTKANKSDYRAVLFEDLDPDSDLYGAMCMGTQGFQISNKRTADGKDWDWSTAATANGIFAESIVTGILASANYNPNNSEGFAFNLANGVASIHHLNTQSVNAEKIVGVGDEFDEIMWHAQDYISGLKYYKQNNSPVGAESIQEYMNLGYREFRNGSTIEDFGLALYPGGDSSTLGIIMRRLKEVMQLRANDLYIMPKNKVYVSPTGDQSQAKEALTGRAEFSDGSYLEFRHGMLIGWKTM